MPLQLCVLASGSSGNATLIWTETSALLIDCGRSRRFIEESFHAVHCDIATLEGILITHGHGDHIGTGTLTLARSRHVPIIIHKDTYCSILEKETLRHIARLDSDLIHYHDRDSFTVGEFLIQPFPSYHSGGFVGRSFGFSIIVKDGPGSLKVGFLTDTGKVDEGIIDALADSNVLVLEANHDPAMVKTSRRHYLNKQWILSDYGHLSNQANAEAIVNIIRRSKNVNSLRHIFMAHISEEHNTPMVAYRQIKEALELEQQHDLQLLPTYHRKRSNILTIA